MSMKRSTGHFLSDSLFLKKDVGVIDAAELNRGWPVLKASNSQSAAE